MIDIVINSTPEWETRQAERVAGAPTIVGKIATIYRKIEGSKREKFSVTAHYSPRYSGGMSIIIKGKSCPTGFEPFLQRWIERFKKSGANWHYDFNKGVEEPKAALLAYFSKWADVRIDYSFTDSQLEALRLRRENSRGGEKRARRQRLRGIRRRK